MIFKSVNIGGSYYLKHYNFAKIWEDMVTLYVNKKLVGINNKFLDLSGDGQENNFKREPIIPMKFIQIKKWSQIVYPL